MEEIKIPEIWLETALPQDDTDDEISPDEMQGGKRKKKKPKSECKSPNTLRHFDIFIDGSATDQAKTYYKKHLRRGGIGIYHPASCTKIARPFPLPNPTNNRCEYYACIFALEWVLRVVANLSLTDRAKVTVVLYSDSQLLINSVTKWMPGWKRRGWKKADGQPVKNQELLEKLDQLISNQLPKSTFVKVKAHRRKPDKGAGEKAHFIWNGNFVADKLANEGRLMHERMDPPKD